MYKYHNLNPISQVGLDEFTKDYAPVSTPETADAILDRKSTRLNSSHIEESRMPSSA